MSRTLVLFIAVVSFIALTYGNDTGAGIDPQPPPNTTTETPTTTTTSAPTTTTTKPTTTKPTTTTSKPTTTTTQPTTTATEPTTTAPPETTTPTTTPASTTTTPTPATTSAPITTPAPAPAPPTPQAGNWTVREDNVTCIIAAMAIQLNVSYEKADKTTDYASIIVPGNGSTTATGVCGNETQTLVLSWAAKGTTNMVHTITLTFMKNETSTLVYLDHIDVLLQANVTEFPGIANYTQITLKNNQSEFYTNYGMSYSCSKVQTLNLTQAGSNVTKGFVSVSRLHVESFHKTSDVVYSSAKDCEPSNSPDIVPIAVGCALVGLVAIVLIAYLVGRRRSQARGYLSIDENGSR